MWVRRWRAWHRSGRPSPRPMAGEQGRKGRGVGRCKAAQEATPPRGPVARGLSRTCRPEGGRWQGHPFPRPIWDKAFISCPSEDPTSSRLLYCLHWAPRAQPSVLRAQAQRRSAHTGRGAPASLSPRWGLEVCRQAAGLSPRGAAGTGTHPPPGQAGRRDTSPERGSCRLCGLSPGPSPPLTSRAADRHSSSGCWPWPWPCSAAGALLCGRGL